MYLGKIARQRFVLLRQAHCPRFYFIWAIHGGVNILVHTPLTSHKGHRHMKRNKANQIILNIYIYIFLIETLPDVVTYPK